MAAKRLDLNREEKKVREANGEVTEVGSRRGRALSAGGIGNTPTLLHMDEPASRIDHTVYEPILASVTLIPPMVRGMWWPR